MAAGKKYTDATKRYDREHLHTPEEALAIAKSLATKNFDESIEAAIRLGVDPRKADQMVRGTVALPAGTGKDIRVAVFAQGDAAAALVIDAQARHQIEGAFHAGEALEQAPVLAQIAVPGRTAVQAPKPFRRPRRRRQVPSCEPSQAWLRRRRARAHRARGMQ